MHFACTTCNNGNAFIYTCDTGMYSAYAYMYVYYTGTHFAYMCFNRYYLCLPVSLFCFLCVSRLVNLVRSNTAKVTLYTLKAKIVMMENLPQADFEASFYDGMSIKNPTDDSYTTASKHEYLWYKCVNDSTFSAVARTCT